jgi:hypothetical protein
VKKPFEKIIEASQYMIVKKSQGELEGMVFLSNFQYIGAIKHKPVSYFVIICKCIEQDVIEDHA